MPSKRTIIIVVCIPDLDGSVRAAGDKSRPVGAKGDTPYCLGVSTERLDQVARLSVPQLDFGSITRSCELSSVGAERDTMDGSIVCPHCRDQFPRLRIPQQVLAITDTSQTSAIGAESQAPYIGPA